MSGTSAKVGVKIILLLLLLTLEGNSETLMTQALFIGAESQVVQGRLTGNDITFYASWNQLVLDKKWLPGETPFPLDLSSGSERAKQSLAQARQITNRLNLQRISLRRLWVPHRMTEVHGMKSADFTNQWSVRHSFLRQDTLPYIVREESVFTLMDGSFAEERLESKVARDIRFSPKQFESFTNHSSVPLVKVSRGDFAIPKIQWNPVSERFPLDLNQAVIRAKDRLIQTESIKPEALVLESICIEFYIPFESIKAKGLNYFDNQNHWWVVFYFSSSAGRRIEHAVHMQLDSTIL